MASSLPVVRDGGWYHIVNRGIAGTSLFPTPEAMTAFVERLAAVALRFRIEVHAYCVMGTHYHLLARGMEAELLEGLEQLETGFPHGTGRARLRRLSMGRHLLLVTRYIHRNPVEAGLVDTPQEWAWSSYHGYLDRLEAPPWLRTDAVLGWLGSIAVRRQYRRLVERL